MQFEYLERGVEELSRSPDANSQLKAETQF